jgi:hypothetical protein
MPRSATSPTRPGRRPKPCKVCGLPASEADLLNGGLLAGWSPRSLAARFTSINRKDVVFHAKNCVIEKKEDECE